MALQQGQSGGPAGPRQPGERREAVRNALIESRLTPNAISMTGFALCIVSAVLVWNELWILGGVAYIVGSVCDTLDGRYSRMSGKGSPFGAFLDSTLDRMEEGIVLTAVAYTFAKDGKDVEAAITAIAVLASLMVSYTRARAEALGVECKVGIGSRGDPRRRAVDRPAVRPRPGPGRLLAARARRLRAGRDGHHHHHPANRPRPSAAARRRRPVTAYCDRGLSP